MAILYGPPVDVVRRRPAWQILKLFLEQAGVASDALPSGILVDPGIGEAAGVLIRLAVVKTLGVIDADNDGGIAIELDLEILHAHDGGLELGIANVGEKLVVRAELTVPFGAHDVVADQTLQGAGIMRQLRLVPHSFERDELAFLRSGRLVILRGSKRHQQKTA